MPLQAIDLCCGAGALSHGLAMAGVEVVLGVDQNTECEAPFMRNNPGAVFVARDAARCEAADIDRYWTRAEPRLLAFGAPCQPYSQFNARRQRDQPAGDALLDRLTDLALELGPEYVMLENVSGIVRSPAMDRLRSRLSDRGYDVKVEVIDAAVFGVPQNRRRTVLLASNAGVLPEQLHLEGSAPDGTVARAILDLPALSAGASDRYDPLHRAAGLSARNLERIRASTPGGSWESWPDRLLLECHRRGSGRSYTSAYGRMRWDRPAPTITTKFFNYGSGRFGHPEQDRAISAREAARFQGFPDAFEFSDDDGALSLPILGRLIGNAVPIPLARSIGNLLMDVQRMHHAA